MKRERKNDDFPSSTKGRKKILRLEVKEIKNTAAKFVCDNSNRESVRKTSQESGQSVIQSFHITRISKKKKMDETR